MSVTAAIIYDRIVGLETVYGETDYAEALLRAVQENDATLLAIEDEMEANGWRRPE